MPNKTAVFDTARGTIEVELFADEAPNTVANFEKLANAAFYDGTTFHRVIANFMIQDRKSTRLNSSHLVISYAVFCLKKKKIDKKQWRHTYRYSDSQQSV